MFVVKLPQGCKPLRCASADETRPNLRNARLALHPTDGTWWLQTTDAFVFTSVKVDLLDGQPVETFVPRGAVEDLQRNRAVRLEANRATTTYAHQTTIHEVASGLQWPDSKSLGLWDDLEGQHIEGIGLNPKLLMNIAEAFGLQTRKEGVHLLFNGELRTIHVRAQTDPQGEKLRALLMPIRRKDR